MSEEAKRIGVGALIAKPSFENRKPSSEDRKPLSAASSSPVGKKVIIKSADMKDDMQKEAVDIAITAFEKHSVEKDVAEYIKKEFDKKHGPTWHCIVGKNFGWSSSNMLRRGLLPMGEITLNGSYVTHETNHFVYFYLDSKGVLLFKSG